MRTPDLECYRFWLEKETASSNKNGSTDNNRKGVRACKPTYTSEHARRFHSPNCLSKFLPIRNKNDGSLASNASFLQHRRRLCNDDHSTVKLCIRLLRLNNSKRSSEPKADNLLPMQSLNRESRPTLPACIRSRKRMHLPSE